MSTSFPCVSQTEAVIGHIEQTLSHALNCPHMSRFSPEARLNEDLYLDSVMIMQLLLHLELEQGYDVPDAALSKEAFSTVAGLAAFLLQHQHEVVA